ncbi:COP9 signalosome complex subunit 1 [Phytophthora cinnamomi]|uniref:COP9 signalosome complex subunit 1 n=1 Tax=Phytophthora cinnamomi TaxID=4785 RepID=UPI003559383E|nr:COP9 signalosome complex subunit 1 [Phytophthora cinnamomi]
MDDARGDIYQLRHDTNEGSETVRGEVSGVHDRVNTITTKLKEYANVMDVFQNDIRSHTNSISVLTSKVKKEKEHIKVVDTKVENHRNDFNNRFTELTQKFQELPLQLAALQPAPPSHIPEKFTFQTNDEKLSLQTHLKRLDGTKRAQGYTDLQPFTIPEDMKSKVETRIRQQEASKREADARAAAELADAYRRLQLAAVNSNNPRLSEVHMTLDRCQQEVKRAFQLIRTSNLQLYSYCESKAERMEITALQNEIKQLRTRIREIENCPRPKQLQFQLGGENTGTPSDGLVVGDKSAAPSAKRTSQHLSSSQIPVLRVSLLELSRNLNLLKHRWKKHKRLNPNSGTNVNPVAQKHLDKLVELINDAYASMAQEPVDLAAAEAHVEKVGRVLGSDFSMQILALIGGRSDEPESYRFPVAITARAAAGEMAAALCKYSEAFTDMFFRNEADNKVATAAMNEWASEKRTVENIGREVSSLARSQHVLEVTLARLAAAMQRKNVLNGNEVDGDGSESEVDVFHSWTTMGDELQQLKVHRSQASLGL